MNYMWLGIIFLLVVLEMSTAALVSIWFIASGILALLASLFIDNVLVQFAIFVIGGIILLLTTRKFS